MSGRSGATPRTLTGQSSETSSSGSSRPGRMPTPLTLTAISGRATGKLVLLITDSHSRQGFDAPYKFWGRKNEVFVTKKNLEA